MIIPHEQLSEAALTGVIEEFVTREGTEYGAQEIELERKVAQVRRQLQSGEVVIVFDEESGTTGIQVRDR